MNAPLPSEKLLPCPFCGRPASVQSSRVYRDFWVTCKNERSCGIDGPFRATLRGAIAAWNKRKP